SDFQVPFALTIIAVFVLVAMFPIETAGLTGYAIAGIDYLGDLSGEWEFREDIVEFEVFGEDCGEKYSNTAKVVIKQSGDKLTIISPSHVSTGRITDNKLELEGKLIEGGELTEVSYTGLIVSQNCNFFHGEGTSAFADEYGACLGTASIIANRLTGDGCGVAEKPVAEPIASPVTCEENWICEEWGECVEGDQTRRCADANVCGTTELIPYISQSALDLNFDGLMIESHYLPEIALSDKDQQLSPNALNELLESLVVRQTTTSDSLVLSSLETLRNKIDTIDEEILEKLFDRMTQVEMIGEFKKKNNITILQPERWNEIIHTRINSAKRKGLSADLIFRIIELIHQESIRKQTQIMNKMGNPELNQRVDAS
ncbi:MAG: bifunctional 3-deoxy-7-phosphoheptulonate synthase/chorismate mutase type II, partial [Bacteroidetes bacterium]|nr:bifunctional 3-deoxy-7-phosphoheptulonate synthase/chorismate mutase type II [Bacteroidota bacterium]